MLFHIAPFLAFLGSSALTVPPDPPSGKAIYEAKCASCHGAKGEGVPDKYPHTLEGDRTIPQLAKLIARTMPEDKPGTCVGEEAEKVATYIYDAFYSVIARERNRPARVSLARLTVKQYRNAVTDLVGSFRWQVRLEEKRGLKAEYYDDRNFRKEKRKAERVDPQVQFDFDVKSPIEGQIDPRQFAIRWTGSLWVPETGMYDLVVSTDQAARLFLNDNEKAVVDGWVKSGNDTEYKASIFLLGGRLYPLRLEFSKATQGVNDQNKDKKKPPAKAFVSLKWKPPHGPLEVIPERNLTPQNAPVLFVSTVPFPPDDRSLGWERGTAVTREWDQAVTEGAIETTAHILERLNELAGVKDGAMDRAAKLKDWCKTFAERAFRRPLSPQETARYVEKPFATAKVPEEGVKKSLLLVLKSPRFLYRESPGDNDSFTVASRLSFGLWDSLPDRELLQEAKANRLDKPEQIQKQIERMLGDTRARVKLHDFLLTWLKANASAELSKDPKRFAGFDEQLVADLRVSLDILLEESLWSKESDFRQLLQTPDLAMSDRMAAFYGIALPKGNGFRKVSAPGERMGVLTHPYLLSSLSYTKESSPIHRGVFLARGILGIGLKPPPEAVAPVSPDLQPDLNTRERVMAQTRAAACMTCHGVINPLGYTLENFDAVGRLRKTDNNKPVDTTGSYVNRDGDLIRFDGVKELAKFLVQSPEVHAAFTEKMFHHLVQQPVRAYGPNQLDQLRSRFVAGGFNMRKLAVDILLATAHSPKASTVSSNQTPPEPTRPTPGG